LQIHYSGKLIRGSSAEQKKLGTHRDTEVLADPYSIIEGLQNPKLVQTHSTAEFGSHAEKNPSKQENASRFRDARDRFTWEVGI
jgi:hypothetical protein